MKKPTLLDARSSRGIMSRGKAIYPGGSPNPTGINQSSLAHKLLMQRRKKNGLK